MMRKSAALRLVLVLNLLLAPFAVSSRAQGESKRRGITPEDYFAFEFLSDPQLSPDGRWVAYVMTTVDQRQNRRQSNIWIAAVDGSRPPRQFTTSAQSSTSPRWSPDGQYLAFLSARPADTNVTGAPAASSSQTTASPTPGTPSATPSTTATPAPAGTPPTAATPATPPSPTTPGVPSALQTTTAGPETPRAQIYVLALEGGEARRVTNLRNGVSLFRWSPDGKRFAVVSRTGPSDVKPPSSDVRHYRHTSYKFNDTGWFDDKRNHIWVVDFPTGAARQITSGEEWNDSDPQWSPDGTRIAFVSDRTGRAFEESRNTDVWVISAEGGPLTKISDHDEADASPRWSPDGKTIAFTGQTREREHPKIWLAPASGGAASRLAARDLDLIPSNLEWAEQGRALYFETGVRGESHLFRVDVGSGALSQVTKGSRAIRNVDIHDATGRIVYTSAT